MRYRHAYCFQRLDLLRRGALTAADDGAGLVWFDQLYERGTGNLNLNYRKGIVNVFGSYSKNHQQGANSLHLERYVRFQDTTTFFDQNSWMTTLNRSHSFKIGADINLSKRQTLGFQINGFANNEEIDMTNTSDIYTNDLRSGGIEVENDRPGHWSNHTYNINYKATFDSLGRELTADFDYAYYNGNSFDNTTTSFLNAEGGATGEERLRSAVPVMVDIRAFKADYVHPLRSGLKLEGGVKGSFVTTDNDVKFELFREDEWSVDSTKTNHFK